MVTPSLCLPRNRINCTHVQHRCGTEKNQGKSHGKSHEDWEFLSNIRKPFVTDKGGMVPAQVSDHHVAVVAETLDEALKAADVSMKDIQLIAFSQGPGIGTCLRIGAATARSLALRYTIPLIGVNHCVAHLEIGRILSGEEDLFCCTRPVRTHRLLRTSRCVSFVR